MPAFSPSTYLRGLGWSGPGTALNDSPHARAKPVISIQKRTLAGVGKDRDTSFPWWEAVFEGVAKKAAHPTTNATISKEREHRTSTGILSPLPPPLASTSRLNQDIMGDAKREGARLSLYRNFLRGEVLAGNAAEDDRASSITIKVEKGKAKEEEGEEERKERKKEKKRKRKAEAVDELSPPSPSSSTLDDFIVIPTSTSDSDALTVLSPTKKKKKKRKVIEGGEYLSPEETIAAEELAYREAREAARRAEKEEKKLRKVVRKALEEKSARN